ncbi:putative F-box/FBD/LRR-repeat protein At2g05300 isoform X3 [Arabidopsis lyrata subsp. lyrata]|uniref:putative F-box/FBD/LRR-repeat protein At2g05300 isoform X3 n=1 Tax=Arabidopsis lyrata subsp. lyrata TaxID=81972 RepID=UPI000A29EA5A|nr:putative F-box/FBD/LRR-repeat protein At2g05300 isoform X3 [Arabidopsis lyrata subsp. lyrata]|eukprot:XP_020871338.1 putative F-box/FBD/LRR-repeat protein At2g05300 isoform X3 [Arabidopsis lyrata subsp. lyrata]
MACSKVLKEDRISELPDPLICQILTHLPAKDTVRTSVLSIRWTNIWLCVPSLKLTSRDFSNFNAFVSFGDRFFHSDRSSCIHKLELTINENEEKSYIISWIDAAVKRKVQHLCVRCHIRRCYPEMPISLYDAAFERFISCCPVLEDLRINGCVSKPQPFRVHSRSLKRLYIGDCYSTLVDSVPGVVIDAPQLCCLSILDNKSKRFKMIYNYSKSESLPQFSFMSRLSVTFSPQDLKWLATFLESCPNLKSLVVVLFDYYHYEELHSEEMNKIKCLQSSLEFVDFKLFSGHVAEMKLVRCFLENCAILKKLTLHLDSKSTEDEIVKTLLEIPRASTTCEVVIVKE